MKKRNKILTGLVLSGLIATSIFANSNMTKENNEVNSGKHCNSLMIKSYIK